MGKSLPPALDMLEAGQAALRQGAWENARAHFRAHLARAPDAAHAWEGLGTACYWLQDTDALFEARRQAYRHYRTAGDARSAARVATWLAGDFQESRGEGAVARGWLERARQLLDGMEPSLEHAQMQAMEAHLALTVDNDAAAALAAAVEAREIASRLGGVDQEMLARASEGLALIASGDVAAGLRRLDAAAAAAFSGEMSDLAPLSITCCYVIHGCERVRDFPRASEWCGRFEELCTRRRLGKFLTFCRIQHGTLLVWRGEWKLAESELTAAREDYERARPVSRSAALVRLGELRRRQGRWDEAAALLDEAHTHPRAGLSRAALALDRGDPLTAEDLALDALGQAATGNAAERVGALDLVVLARLARHDLPRAWDAQRELERAAAAVGTAPVRAAACFTGGLLVREKGDAAEARRLLHDAADRFERADAPYEEANARLELADTLNTLGRRAAAVAQARAALALFERLGAARAAARAGNWLNRVGASARRPAGGSSAGRLTPRQLDVLRLVARGLSNREIGEQLSVSEFTVRRHLANAYSRMGVSSRAAAVALALRTGML